jgi:hypothetical protein
LDQTRKTKFFGSLDSRVKKAIDSRTFEGSILSQQRLLDNSGFYATREEVTVSKKAFDMSDSNLAAAIIHYC